jgi:hypothetical protein
VDKSSGDESDYRNYVSSVPIVNFDFGGMRLISSVESKGKKGGITQMVESSVSHRVLYSSGARSPSCRIRNAPGLRLMN